MHWLEVGHGSGVVVRLCVGSDGWVGYSDAGGPGLVCVLEGVRVERLPEQGQQATSVAVFEFEWRRSSRKHSVCNEMRRASCFPDE